MTSAPSLTPVGFVSGNCLRQTGVSPGILDGSSE